jgi:hypothetical protein
MAERERLPASGRSVRLRPMEIDHILLAGFATLALVACGPDVSEVRMSNYPPREENCSLEYVQLNMPELSSGKGPWELVGQIVLQEGGARDPFSPEYKEIVRPRACAMGGEAIGIVMNTQSEGIVSSSTAISYGVLRHRRPGGEQPKQF